MTKGSLWCCHLLRNVKTTCKSCLIVKKIRYNSLYTTEPASFPGYTKRGQKMNKKNCQKIPVNRLMFKFSDSMPITSELDFCNDNMLQQHSIYDLHNTGKCII